MFGPCICKLSRALDRTPNVRRLVLAGNKYVPTTALKPGCCCVPLWVTFVRKCG